MEQVAAGAGFTDATRMGKVFRRLFGLTPAPIAGSPATPDSPSSRDPPVRPLRRHAGHSLETTKYTAAPIEPATGIVSIQATTILLATPQRTALSRRIAP